MKTTSKFVYVLHGVEGAQCINAYRDAGGVKAPHGFVYLGSSYTIDDGSTYPRVTESEKEKNEQWAFGYGAEYATWFAAEGYKARVISPCAVRKLLRGIGCTFGPFEEKTRG